MLLPNKLYFSSLILDPKFGEDWHQIQTILTNHQVYYGFITETADLWVRDFMPLQLPDGSFKQFRYEPSYLNTLTGYRSDPRLVNNANGIEAIYSTINLDGGNVVRHGNRIIMTERIFAENPEWSDHNALIKELEKELDAEILLIKDYHKSTDVSGHADGMIRWKDEKTVLVNKPDEDFNYMKVAVSSFLKDNMLESHKIPWFETKEKESPASGIGLYINYLQIKDLIIIPKFETKNNLDEDVLKLFENIFPDKRIEQANINNIARLGGLLNCISWDIYEPELRIIYKSGNLLLICLAEEFNEGKKPKDVLVVQADLQEKKMINTAWSGQKTIKHVGYFEPVKNEESNNILREINRTWETIEIRRIINNLKQPGEDARRSIRWQMG